MTAAERKRRSRAHGGQLRQQSAARVARLLGGSAQWYRDLFYVRQNGVSEWERLIDNGKGQLVIGISTQRQMIEHLSPDDQRHMINLALKDKKEALATWRVVKGELRRQGLIRHSTRY